MWRFRARSVAALLLLTHETDVDGLIIFQKSRPQRSDSIAGRVIAQTAQDTARGAACDVFSISRNHNGSPACHDGLGVTALTTFSVNSESLRLRQSLKILRRERVEEWRETSRPNAIHHAIDRGRFVTEASNLVRSCFPDPRCSPIRTSTVL